MSLDVTTVFEGGQRIAFITDPRTARSVRVDPLVINPFDERAAMDVFARLDREQNGAAK